uniref:Uncharacterized protein n=1 Tax=Arundo donax TaxID=35708 RepID=A0A0A9A2B2_ARUDO
MKYALPHKIFCFDKSKCNNCSLYNISFSSVTLPHPYGILLELP